MAGALVRWCVARCGGGGWASPGGRLPVLRGASGVRRCSSPGRPSSGAGSQGSATRVSRVRSMRTCGPAQHRPHSVRPCGPALLAVGVAEGRPRGAFHRCGGRLVSGAVPPPAARPPERAARVLRPVCPGCGRCGRVDPARAPQRAPLRAGVARCGGCGRASPGGGAFHRCEGRLVSGAVPSPVARPPERAARVPRPVCPGCGRCGHVDPAPAPQRAPLRAGVARCGGGGRASPGGVPSIVVRGAWCQALSLPRPRSSFVACSQGSATRVSRARSMRACGPSTGPTACVLAGRHCSLLGWRNGVPGGGAFHRCEGRLVSGAVPSPAARPPERAARVPRPACPGCGRCGRVDPAPASQRVCPCGPALFAVGVAEGRPRGGLPSTVVRGAWCQALSLPRPLVLRSVQPGFRDPRVPGAVDAGVRTQHRPHSVRPCGPTLLAVGVAEGRPRGGRLPPL